MPPFEEQPTFRKPPIGVPPQREHNRQRARDLMDAIERYIEADMKPSEDWFIELRQIIDRL